MLVLRAKNIFEVRRDMSVTLPKDFNLNRKAYSVGIVVAALALGSCGKKNDDNKNGDCGGCGSNGQLALKPTVDLQGGNGLLVIDNSAAAAKLALAQHNQTALTLGLSGAPILNIEEQGTSLFFAEGSSSSGSGSSGNGPSGDGSLQKVDSKGEVKNALSVPTKEKTQNGPPPQKLPKVLTIAISPAKDVYLHFEHPWQYKDSANGENAFEPGSGYQCQIFKVKGGTLESLVAAAPTAENLECIDNLHFINSWTTSTRNSVFQFDKDSNVYYPGSLPNSGKMVVYKRSRDGSSVTEVINSNICVQDFLVTKNGGVFYTGTSSCGGSGGGSGGFFRYVSSGGDGLKEIARDWWNFIFEPIAGVETDKAVFFGPDPTSSATAGWDSACLFKFDPAGTTNATSYDKVITCGGNIWDWMNMSRAEDKTTYGNGFMDGNSASAAWKTEFQNRCESEGQVFAGGGSQISAIKQDSTGNLYVVGKVRRKNLGAMSCRIEVRGPHCAIDGSPAIFSSGTTKYDSTSCSTAKGTWIDKGTCTNGTSSTSSACFTATQTWNRDNVSYFEAKGTICASTDAKLSSQFYDNSVVPYSVTTAGANLAAFAVNNMNCKVVNGSSSSGDQWTSEYQGFAKVNLTTKTLSLLSLSSEKAINLWMIKDIPYFSSYNTSTSKYYLKKYNTTTSALETLSENFETYNLSDATEEGKLFYDGLDFSNNSYSFGTVTSASPYTKAQKTGLTGTVKTIVVFPK